MYRIHKGKRWGGIPLRWNSVYILLISSKTLVKRIGIFLIKFWYTDQVFSGNIFTPLCLKSETFWSCANLRSLFYTYYLQISRYGICWTRYLLDTVSVGHGICWTRYLLDTVSVGHVICLTRYLLDTVSVGNLHKGYLLINGATGCRHEKIHVTFPGNSYIGCNFLA